MIAAENNTPLKKHVWALIFLNIIDGLLTYFGLIFGIINEGNPLLKSLPPAAILAIKLILSLCLYCLLFTPFVFIQSDTWRYFLVSAITLYSIILLLHLVWISSIALL